MSHAREPANWCHRFWRGDLEEEAALSPPTTRPARAWLALALGAPALFLLPEGALAENGCPAGYEPWRIPVQNQDDCVAIPNYGHAADVPRSPQPAINPTWHSFAAVVVWADSADGDRYVTIEKYLIVDEAVDLARAKALALEKCQRNRGWTNCSIATWTINGSIAIGRDSRGRLRARNDLAPQQAVAGLLERCRTDGQTCSIERTIDSRAQFQ